MLGPSDFILIVGVLLGLLAAWIVLLGMANRSRGSTAPGGRARRDVIAEGVVRGDDVDEMLAAENARLRAQGRPELTRGELEARVVGDTRARGRLQRLRLRRRPERARPLA